jgi:hypothetical protein
MIIYLYLKQHNKTGLKYFGKTTKNPYKYNGSGLHWLRHLKVHGCDISTLNVWKFERQNVCTRFALWYSKKFNIVESEEYANLVEEAGVDGCPMHGERNGMYGKNHTTEAKEKMSEARKKVPRESYCGERNGMYGKTTELNPMYGKHHTAETKEKMSEARKDKSYEEFYGAEKAEELRKKRAIESIGRIKTDETRQKLSLANKGKKRTLEQRINISNAQKGLQAGSNNPRALKIKAISPEGEIFHIHGEFRIFCESKSLSPSTARNILKRNHKPKSGNCVGWSFSYE